MNTPKLDWTKPLQTRAGQPARVLGKLNRDDHPIVVAVVPAGGNGKESVYTYSEVGHIFSTEHIHDCDLINVPVKGKRKVWVNIYRVKSYATGVMTHPSQEEAARCENSDCVARKEIEIEYTEGEGL